MYAAMYDELPYHAPSSHEPTATHYNIVVTTTPAMEKLRQPRPKVKFGFSNSAKDDDEPQRDLTYRRW